MITDLKDLEFTVVAELRGSELFCDFTVYKIMGEHPDGSLCWIRDVNGAPDPVDTLKDADVYLHGSIKFDGCSDWHFDEQDDVMLHFCSKGTAEDIGALFGYMYEMAKKLIPKWVGDDQ